MINLPELPFYDDNVPLAIVHRGGDGAGIEKENSLAAFDSAYRAGLRYGETDTVSTLDGVALAIHGSSGLRQQKKTGLPPRTTLQQMTFSQVRAQVRVGGEKVPTLQEVLVSFPDMRFFIDPKTDQSVKPLADLINKLSLHNRISIGAFNFKRTKAVTELVRGGRTNFVLPLASWVRWRCWLAACRLPAATFGQLVPLNLLCRLVW